MYTNKKREKRNRLARELEYCVPSIYGLLYRGINSSVRTKRPFAIAAILIKRCSKHWRHFTPYLVRQSPRWTTNLHS